MAGIKISALPASGAVLGTDVYPAVQAASTVKQTVNQLTTYMDANVVLNSTAQVTGLTASLASFLPLSGGTMTGNINMGMNYINNLSDPINPQDAATKAYADLSGGGFTVILAADAASVADVPSTQAGAGVGATLTDNSGTFAVFSIDGISPALNSRILIKNQTASANNGVYVLTTQGDTVSVPWQLTRATDYDQAAEIQPGTLIAVDNGTANANTSWLETATVVTVDTDPVLFSQFTFAPSSFFLIANNLSEGVPATMRANLGLTGAAIMALPVSGTNGGTGVNNGASTITIGGNVEFSGAFTFTGTITGNTSVTFPTTGTLITSSQPTINQPNIVGVPNNSAAAAGSVGELISSVVASGAAVATTSTVTRNITSIALTAGDWDVWGNAAFIPSIGQSQGISWISTTSATLPDASLRSHIFVNSQTGNYSTPVPQITLQLSVPTTVYLSCQTVFISGTVSVCGGIYARRRR